MESVRAASAQQEALRVAYQLEKERRQNSMALAREEIHSLRTWLSGIMQTHYYECALGVIVLFNVILLIVQTDAAASCPPDMESCSPKWAEVADYVLPALYTIDVGCAMFAQRRSFCYVLMNWIDLGIVLLGYIEICIFVMSPAGEGQRNSVLSIFRMLRIARMTRVAKLIRPLPELYKLVTGFCFTLRAICWGFVMLVLLLVVWSIIILQILSNLDVKSAYQDSRFAGYWCEEAMQSTANMGILLWQILITGDSWGACTIPVILKYPAMYWVYAAAFVCISLGFTNLILALIVERATCDHEEDIIRRLLDRQIEQEKDIEKFRETFSAMDTDNSGTLSLDELIRGFDDRDDFKKDLLRFGIHKSDFEQLFRCVDLDNSGDISYVEFVEAMIRSQRQETGTQLMMIQVGVKKLLAGMDMVLQKLSSQPPHKVSELRTDQRVGTGSGDMAVDISLEGAKARPIAETQCATPEVPCLEHDLACLKQVQRETLELKLQEIARALQQHSASLAQEAHELTASFSQMQGGVPRTGMDEKPRTLAHASQACLAGSIPASLGLNRIVPPSLRIAGQDHSPGLTSQDDDVRMREDINSINTISTQSRPSSEPFVSV
eukprot:TRINITY_DN28819_c0_g1_i2.p1 TRINITY_DN28819_c0_g1~~TRINITY_DN28819_c0_g1_i2.p1  ORF type:complete len:633 (-),score=97.78 TRINITY_DN28819_c0_g1_i2:51-1874(-)